MTFILLLIWFATSASQRRSCLLTTGDCFYKKIDWINFLAMTDYIIPLVTIVNVSMQGFSRRIYSHIKNNRQI